MIEDSGKGKLREATVAGIFYPENPEELRSRVSALLDAASPATTEARAIVSPHAGLDYSGDLAALAWKSASGRSPRVVLALAPFHRAEDSLVYLPESDSFDTPLGPAIVDGELVEELRDCGTIFTMNDIPHLEEHGIEVQIPFMRLLVPEAKLVPIVMGKPSAAMVKSLGSALGLVFGPIADETLVVLSTNLASGKNDDEVRRHSDELVELIRSGDARAVLDSGCNPDDPTCGAGCLAAFLSSTLSKGLAMTILGRHDSSKARQSGDEHLVDYMAAAFSRAEPGAAR